jgi:prepilin-type N-terminal cleavage/methylation domain-containing protein
MNNKQKHSGFSLTEVLIAVGILSVGMIFIAGVFPAGIYLTTIATERTIAAVAADEAFAKIKIYATGDPNRPINYGTLTENALAYDFNDIFPAIRDANCNELLYPSTGTDDSAKQYCWSALCRRADPNDRLVQITVFISRKTGPNLKYPAPPDGSSGTVDWPRPVKVNVSGTAGNNELTITGEKTFINDGYTIVDDATGRIYRVLERYKNPDNTILLDRDWDDKDWQGNTILLPKVWVVPPPVGGGRYPCIAVYQKVIRF